MARRIDLGRARREAKALLKAARAGDAAALARIGSGAAPRPADAQRALARELGERSWPRLVRRAEAEAVERGERARRLVLEATDRRRDHAEALLALDREPTLEVALVHGDVGSAASRTGGRPRAREPAARPAALAAAALRDPLRLPRRPTHRGPARLRPRAARGRRGPERRGRPLRCRRHRPRARDDRAALAAGADPDDDESLYHATEADEHACVRPLLDAGATVPGTNALDKEDPELVRLLLAHAPGPDEPWRARWPERERALRWAVWRGRSPEIVRMLAAAGSDVEWTGDGIPPYRLAVRTGRGDLAATLLELGARAELERATSASARPRAARSPRAGR